MFVSLSLSPGKSKKSNPGNEIGNHFLESGKLHFCISDRIPKLRLDTPWAKNDSSSMFKGLLISLIERVFFFICAVPRKLKEMELKKKKTFAFARLSRRPLGMPNNNWQRYSNCGRMKSLYSLAALLFIMFFYSTNGQKG